MDNIFMIEFPAGVSNDQVEALQTEIQQLEKVEAAGSTEQRSVDIVTLGMWIQTASEAMKVAGVALPLFQKVAELIRGKGIKGAKIQFKNGTEISVDEISVADMERLIRAANAPSASPSAS
jgi:hypothetical protein